MGIIESVVAYVTANALSLVYGAVVAVTIAGVVATIGYGHRSDR